MTFTQLLLFLIPCYMIAPGLRLYLAKLFGTYLLVIGIMVMGVALTRIKQYLNMIRSTQSGSTFNYVKKRQE